MKNFSFLGVIILFLGGLFACNSTQKKQRKSPFFQPTLLSDSSKKASCVYLTKNKVGMPFVSWVEQDTATKKAKFYFAKWLEKENKFGKKREIPMPKNTSIHEEGMPKIAFEKDGTMVALFETSTPALGHHWGIGDIQMAFSSDTGKTWTPPKSIYPTKPKEYSISFSSITSLPSGELGISCLGTNLDTTYLGRPVLFIKTKGEDFVAPVVVTHEACECCRTAIASDKMGRISVAYRDLKENNIRDISVSTSIDGGMLFHYTKDVTHDNWSINGCPHNGPSIVTKNNKNYIAWFTNGDQSGVHSEVLNASGEVIKEKYISKNGDFIQLRVLPNNTIVTAHNEVYQENEKYYSKIVLHKINDTSYFKTTVSSLHKNASYPILLSLSNQYVLTAWRNDDFTVHYRLVAVDSINTMAKPLPSHSIAKKRDTSKIKLVTDVVCEMKINKEKAQDSIVQEGKTYYFCSSHCKHQFLKSPDSYIVAN